MKLRRRSPGDDLTTQLVQAEEDGTKLSNEELTANIILLFGAGHETTVNLIGNGLLSCSLSRGGAQFFTPRPRTAPIVGAHSRRQDPKTPVEQALMRGLGTA